MKTHIFDSTQQANDQYFDFCWGHDNVRGFQKGDIFVVESEGVVGVLDGNLFAVTESRRNIPEFIIDWLLQDPQELKRIVDAIPLAINEAKRLGFEIDPKFACFAQN